MKYALATAALFAVACWFHPQAAGAQSQANQSMALPYGAAVSPSPGTTPAPFGYVTPTPAGAAYPAAAGPAPGTTPAPQAAVVQSQGRGSWGLLGLLGLLGLIGLRAPRV